MSANLLPALLFLLVPLLPVALVPLLHRSPRALAAAPWIPPTALLLLPFHGTVVEYPWLLLGTRVGIDNAGFALVLLAVIVWTAAGWYARRSLPANGQPRFFIFWLAAWCGNLCVFITQDAASFYAAYAMMTFAAWGLVVHRREAADYRAGRIYLVMALIGEALILAGLFLVAAQIGNATLGPRGHDLAAIDHAGLVAALFAAGFGVKMAVIGLHLWLPATYERAPTAATAVLAGVMLKAGLAGWLRFLPLGSDGFAILGGVLVAAGLVMGFYAAVVGICQARPKLVIAYSSPSQMLFVTVPIGLALLYPGAAGPLALLAVGFAVHHGLAKAALFLGIDLAHDRPLLGRALLWIPALSLAGLPLTSGALAKISFKAHLPATASWLDPLLLASSVATTLLVLRFLSLVPWHGTTRRGTPAAHWLLLLVASLGLPWLLYGLNEPFALLRPFFPGYLAETLGPIVLGIGLALLARRYPVVRLLPAIPPGDLLALVYRLQRPRLPTMPPAPALPVGAGWIATTERHLDLLTAALALWLGMLLVLFLL